MPAMKDSATVVIRGQVMPAVMLYALSTMASTATAMAHALWEVTSPLAIVILASKATLAECLTVAF